MSKPKVDIQVVPNQDSKITFKVTLNGELDWNSDFVRNAPGYSSFMDEFNFQNNPDFGKALVAYIAQYLNHGCGNIFQSVELSELNLADSVKANFQQAQGKKLSKKSSSKHIGKLSGK